jgi:hypothetical protein
VAAKSSSSGTAARASVNAAILFNCTLEYFAINFSIRCSRLADSSMSARAAAAAADAAKKAASAAAAAKQAAIAAAAEKKARDLKAKIDAVAGLVDIESHAPVLPLHTQFHLLSAKPSALPSSQQYIMFRNDAFAAESKRKKEAAETDFSGSWSLRKMMREKATLGGGLSLAEVVEMENMYNARIFPSVSTLCINTTFDNSIKSPNPFHLCKLTLIPPKARLHDQSWAARRQQAAAIDGRPRSRATA